MICSWGRLGEYFGAQRFGYQPDLITTAKGLTSSYAPMGAVIASDKMFAPFAEGHNSFGHGITFGGHPVAAPPPLPTWRSLSARISAATCVPTRGRLKEMLLSLRDIPIVGDVRGAGYFRAIELVKDQGTKESFSMRNPRICSVASSPARCTTPG